MKRIRKFYKENRIYCILMIISIACCIFMGTICVVYFVNQSHYSVYGDRLIELENYDIDGSVAKLEEFYKKQKSVNETSIDVKGKIVYIVLDVDNKLTNADVQSIATNSLKEIDPDVLGYVDLQFIVKRDSYPPYTGNKSSVNSVVSWSNYKFEKTEK